MVWSVKIFAAGLLLLAIGCRNAAPPVTDEKDSALYYPYAPAYTSGFDKGKDIYGKTVLDFWREWETGDVMKTRSFFADSIRFILADDIFRGASEEVLKKFKARRARYSDVQFHIDYWMPLKATDTGQDMVFVWGRQDCTKLNGEREYMVLHQIWLFNRFGKITEMKHYLTHPH